MSTRTRLVTMLLWATVLFYIECPHALAHEVASEADCQAAVTGLGLSELASIIADPITQRKAPGVVTAAISALGDIGNVDGISVLVDNIAYPRDVVPLPADVECIPKPPVIGSMHYRGRGGLLSDAFPAAKALVEIGDVCIPAILDKLATAERGHEINACLDVLIELKERAEVQAMLELKLASVQSAKEQQRLQSALRMLPGIDRQWDACHGRPSYRTDTLDAGLIDGREKLIQMVKKVSIPPMLIVRDRVLSGARAAADGTALAPAGGLGSLLGLEVTEACGSNTLTLARAGNSRKTLVLTQESKIAKADGESVGLPVAVSKIGEGTLVPLRFVAEYFGAQVKWDGRSRVVWVN